MDQKQKFLAALNEHHEWPGMYCFKFVVPKEQVIALRALLPGELSERSSSAGKYIAVTARANMQSSMEVWAVYEQAAGIEGVLAL